MCFHENVTVAKAAAVLERHNRLLDSRSRGLAGGITAWMLRYATLSMKDVRAKLRSGGLQALRRSYAPGVVAKALSGSDIARLEAQLLELIVKYGLVEAEVGGKAAARGTGVRWVVTPTLLESVMRSKENRVKLLLQSTAKDVRESIQRILADALSESPQPTAGEISRRIARTWFGPAMRAPAGAVAEGLRGSPEEARFTADWARRARDLTADSEHLFSFTRARTIARTELAQARGQGQALAYSDIGVKEVEWLAYPNDGRSGKRKHYQMNNKRITVAAMNGRDKSKWFKLPSGDRTPYPNWMGLPPEQTINCRCSIGAVR